ncbi:MAG: hypothetical protein KH050_14200, partial [Clostridiaceae bacterium]|nr:hypothetical protein [Clostridiaceae bacterium]
TDCVTWSNDSETFEKHDRGGKPYGTVGEKYMDLKTTVGTLNTVSKESGKDTYKLVIGETDNTEDDSTKPLETSFSKVKKDYTELLDREVKVLYKEKDEVYGVFATEDSDVLTGILGDFEKSDAKLKFDGTKYSVGTIGNDATNLVKENGAEASTHTNDIVAYVDAVKDLAKVFPASTGTQDDKIVALNVKTLSIAKVTYVGKDYINATKKAGANFDKIDTDSANYPSDLKKDDYIAIYNAENFADDKMLVEKLDVVEGKITSTKNTGKDDYSVKIDGTWYEQAINTSNGSAYQAITLKDEVAIVVKDGYFVCVDDADAGAKDVALLVKAVEKTSAADDTIEGRMIFADGSDKIVTIKDTEMFASDKTYGDQGDEDGVLVSYKKSGDKYELTKVDGVVSGYDGYAKNATKVEDDKLNGDVKYINNDATVFVRYNDGDDFSVITGKALKNWNSNKTFTSQVLSKKSNGMQYASVAFINLGDENMSGGKDLTYGYVLEASQITTENDKDYTTTLVWNGTEEITLKVEDGDALVEGQVVEYSTNSDETHNIDNTYKLDTNLTRAVVTGFDYDAEKIEGTLTGFKAKNDNNDWIADDSQAITLNISNDDHDSVVLFVDTDGPSGVADGEFQTAAERNDNAKLANIAYYADGSNVKIVIVDTQNKYAK